MFIFPSQAEVESLYAGGTLHHHLRMSAAHYAAICVHLRLKKAMLRAAGFLII